MRIISCFFIFVVYFVAKLWAQNLGTIRGKIIDLSWPFDDNSMYWKNTRPFMFTNQIAGTDLYGYWYATNAFSAGEHAGTHFDAPYHLNPDGWKVGEVPLSRLITNGVTIDLTGEVELLKDNARLLPKHILLWERLHGPIPPNSVILVRFGWSQYYSNKAQYLGLDQKNVSHFPAISKEAADLIADLDSVVGVGVDTASVDSGDTSKDRTVHRVLTNKQIYILENIKIPSDLPDTGYTLFVMPMNIKYGTGAPLRLLAQLKNPDRRDFMSNGFNAHCSPLLILLTLVLYLLF